MNSKVSNITIIREALQNHAANELSREYKIFCVNEKIHTKKEVPSVE
ncbi:hypothetical protein [Enterococcus faecium]|nr:hypothetical protein [Enterococcus faecium]